MSARSPAENKLIILYALAAPAFVLSLTALAISTKAGLAGLRRSSSHRWSYIWDFPHRLSDSSDCTELPPITGPRPGARAFDVRKLRHEQPHMPLAIAWPASNE
jgi:hypothetical protein